MQVRVSPLMRLDLELLKQQKRWLLAQSSTEEVEGLLGIVDFIQDTVLAEGLAKEEDVFDIYEEE